jgi:hypothetical protein
VTGLHFVVHLSRSRCEIAQRSWTAFQDVREVAFNPIHAWLLHSRGRVEVPHVIATWSGNDGPPSDRKVKRIEKADASEDAILGVKPDDDSMAELVLIRHAKGRRQLTPKVYEFAPLVFVVLLSSMNHDDALAVAERMVKSLDRKDEHGLVTARVLVRGVAICPARSQVDGEVEDGC